MKKKVLSIIMSITLAFAMVPALAFTAFATDTPITKASVTFPTAYVNGNASSSFDSFICEPANSLIVPSAPVGFFKDYRLLWGAGRYNNFSGLDTNTDVWVATIVSVAPGYALSNNTKYYINGHEAEYKGTLTNPDNLPHVAYGQYMCVSMPDTDTGQMQLGFCTCIHLLPEPASNNVAEVDYTPPAVIKGLDPSISPLSLVADPTSSVRCVRINYFATLADVQSGENAISDFNSLSVGDSVYMAARLTAVNPFTVNNSTIFKLSGTQAQVGVLPYESRATYVDGAKMVCSDSNPAYYNFIITTTLKSQDDPPYDPVEYDVPTGGGQTVDVNSGADAAFTISIPMAKLTAVSIDDVELVKDEQYTVEEEPTLAEMSFESVPGSIVKVKNDYLKGLTDGNHTIVFSAVDGSATASFTTSGGVAPIPDPIDNPEESQPAGGSSDTSDMLIGGVGIAAIIAACSSIVLVVRRRLKN